MATRDRTMSAEVAVVGGGPAGLVAALALAATGSEVLLVAPRPPSIDRRTTALLDGSIQALESLDVWPFLAADAAPLKFLRLVDTTRRLLRAPEVLFDSSELGLEAFGYNVENQKLRQVLLDACTKNPKIRTIDRPVVAVTPDEDCVRLDFGETQEKVLLVAAADGRKSICREAAGIHAKSKQLPQLAIVLNLRHSAPHRDTSIEFHTEQGPFTFAPLKGNRSSLVWVLRPDEAETMRALPDHELSLEIERRAHSVLGKMEIDTDRAIFPLGTALADRFAGRRIALIGEAAHVLPPIGAQGLNLGIRDGIALADLVRHARTESLDPGDDQLLDDYDRARRVDVRARTLIVDFANRSLMSDFLPLHAARGFGLQLASRVGFFRRALMRQGLGQTSLDWGERRTG